MSYSTLTPAQHQVQNREIISIFHKAELDYRQMEQMFQLLGWGDLPGELKLVIEEDVKAYYDELQGHYCSNCPHIRRRRESVDFWVNSYLDGVCTLQTAVESLRITRI